MFRALYIGPEIKGSLVILFFPFAGRKDNSLFKKTASDNNGNLGQQNLVHLKINTVESALVQCVWLCLSWKLSSLPSNSSEAADGLKLP